LGDQATHARFGKAKRLLNAKDYGRVFENPDVRVSDQHVLLLAKINEQTQHRLGLVIAKKHVRLAVQRNRIKRVAREFFRKLPGGEPSLDVVLLARQGMSRLDNAELSSILQRQWQNLIRRSNIAQSNTDRNS
jgi:ribonuclease P protein component